MITVSYSSFYAPSMKIWGFFSAFWDTLRTFFVYSCSNLVKVNMAGNAFSIRRVTSVKRHESFSVTCWIRDLPWRSWGMHRSTPFQGSIVVVISRHDSHFRWYNAFCFFHGCHVVEKWKSIKETGCFWSRSVDGRHPAPNGDGSKVTPFIRDTLPKFHMGSEKWLLRIGDSCWTPSYLGPMLTLGGGLNYFFFHPQTLGRWSNLTR